MLVYELPSVLLKGTTFREVILFSEEIQDMFQQEINNNGIKLKMTEAMLTLVNKLILIVWSPHYVQVNFNLIHFRIFRLWMLIS